MDSQEEKIIQTAHKLFEKYGIRSVTIDNVCEELRISKKTFYSFFPQKEDLVDSIMSYRENQAFEKLQKLLKTNNAIDSLIIIIKEMKKATDTKSPTMHYDMKKYYGNILQKHEVIQREKVKNWFEENLNQGIQEGFYRDDMDVELISLFHALQLNSNYAEQVYQQMSKYPKKRLMEFYSDFIIHLIANEKGLQYFKEYYRSD